MIHISWPKHLNNLRTIKRSNISFITPWPHLSTHPYFLILFFIWFTYPDQNTLTQTYWHNNDTSNTSFKTPWPHLLTHPVFTSWSRESTSNWFETMKRREMIPNTYKSNTQTHWSWKQIKHKTPWTKQPEQNNLTTDFMKTNKTLWNKRPDPNKHSEHRLQNPPI